MILESAMVGSGEAEAGADKAEDEAVGIVDGVIVNAMMEAGRRKRNLRVIQENFIAVEAPNECEGVTMAMDLCEWRGECR